MNRQDQASPFARRSITRWKLTVLFLFVSGFAPAYLLAQGRLDAVRNEVREPKPKPDKKKRERDHDEDCEDDSENDSILGSILSGFFSSIFSGARISDADGDGEAETRLFIAVEQTPDQCWGQPFNPPLFPNEHWPPGAVPTGYIDQLPPRYVGAIDPHHAGPVHSPSPGYGPAPMRQTYWIGGPPDTPPPSPSETPAPQPSPSLYFAPYPYAKGIAGYMMRHDWAPVRPQLWVGRMWFDFGWTTGDIDRFTGGLLLESKSRWGVDAAWNLFQESTPQGADELDMGDINLLFRFGQSRQVQWRLGVGANWLNDAVDTDWGVNFTLRNDWLPASPWILTSELDVGNLSHAFYLHGALHLGVAWRFLEIFTGYDYRQIGHVDLQGPLLGVRVWY